MKKADLSRRSVRHCRRGEYSPRGILALYKRSLAAFGAATGVEYPTNSGVYSARGVGLSRRPRPDEAGCLEEAARCAGWLHTVAESPKQFPLIRKLFRNGIDPSRGVNSTYQLVDPVHFVRTHPSPHKAEKMLRAVLRRADVILRPYRLHVSWEAIAQVFSRPVHRVGKAAFQAARLTAAALLQRRCGLWMDYRGGRLGRFYSGYGPTPARSAVDPLALLRGYWEFAGTPKTIQRWIVGRIYTGEFSCLRDGVVAAGKVFAVDTTDGVTVVAEIARAVTLHGITVQYGRTEEDRCGDREVAVITRGSRSYHLYLTGEMSAREVAKAAIAAWRQQDQAAAAAAAAAATEAAAANLCANGGTEEFSVLVSYEDARAAGYCRPGTDAWLSQQGLGGCLLLPLREVWHLGQADERARRVALHAARKCLA